MADAIDLKVVTDPPGALGLLIRSVADIAFTRLQG